MCSGYAGSWASFAPAATGIRPPHRPAPHARPLRPPQPPRSGRSTPTITAPTGPRGSTPNPGPTSGDQPQAGRPADAYQPHRRLSSAVQEADHDRGQDGPARTGPGDARLHRHGVQHPVVRRHHLYRCRLVVHVPGDGHRHLLASRDRLVHRRPHAHPARHRRTPAAAGSTESSFTPSPQERRSHAFSGLLAASSAGDAARRPTHDRVTSSCHRLKPDAAPCRTTRTNPRRRRTRIMCRISAIAGRSTACASVKQVDQFNRNLRHLEETAGQTPFTVGSRIATHSTWCVIGNRSNARSDTARYPESAKYRRSRARAAGSHAT
jgi:hypothetical protein